MSKDTGMKVYSDVLDGELQDLTEEIILVQPKDTPLVSMLLSMGKVTKASDITVTWRERELNKTRSELKKEGSTAGTPLKSSRTMFSNICQILERNVSISGTMSALRPHGVGDEFTNELNDRLAELKMDLEYYMLNGVKTAESEDTPRQMNGLYNMMTNTIDKTGKGALTLADLEDGMQLMWDRGCNNDVYLFVNASEKRVINKFFHANDITINTQVLDSKIGIKVDTVETDFGTIHIVLDRHIPVGTVLGVDLSLVEIAELRPTFYKELASDGDYKKGHILVENTIKLLNQYAGFKILNIGK